jgi:glutaredoxin 3
MGTQCGGVKGAFAGGTVYDWSRSDNNNGVSIYFLSKNTYPMPVADFDKTLKEGKHMAKIEIYSSERCPYCVKAKALLDRKGASYEEIDVTNDDDARRRLVEKANGLRTVPQIFINDAHIGGCDDLYAFDKKGELETLLR